MTHTFDFLIISVLIPLHKVFPGAVLEGIWYQIYATDDVLIPKKGDTFSLLPPPPLVEFWDILQKKIVQT